MGRLVPALGFMYTLQYLDLSGNLFYRPIPARMNDLWGLNYLNLSSNNFTGVFPSGIRNLQQLYVLDLHSNQLRGDIQDLSSELRNVEFLDLSYNMFYGSLSMDLHNISSLANTINGQLPSFGSLPNLHVLRLGNNQLFGLIPEELLESLIHLKELDLSGNGFSGPIHVINSTTLSILNLSSNVLSSSLPSSVGGCHKVDLSRNVLTGDISVMQSWEATLDILDLSSNELSGSIPNLTSQFPSLTTHNIKNNSLEGILPPVLGNFQRLSAVDLSLNKLDGPIPPSFFTSMTLINLNPSGNHFTGPIPLQSSRAIGLVEC
ncbi:hypothetical protein CsSME_00008224 [Camellia sinensis var. sinensis]